MQYTATGFAKPIRLIFQALSSRGGAWSSSGRPPHYFVSSVRYEESVHPVYERHLYERGVSLLLAASHQIRRLQSGSLRAYLDLSLRDPGHRARADAVRGRRWTLLLLPLQVVADARLRAVAARR